MSKLLAINNNQNQQHKKQHAYHEFQEPSEVILEKMLTRKEAAAFLKVKENTLAIWTSTKRYEIPTYKVGKYIKYKLSDLQKFQEGVLLS